MSLLCRLLLTAFTLMLVTGCSNDPTATDIKSPCVSNDLDPNSPCVKRSPIGNVAHL